MNSSPEPNMSTLPAARSASASRSLDCHSGPQNHACVASISFCGRNKMLRRDLGLEEVALLEMSCLANVVREGQLPFGLAASFAP